MELVPIRCRIPDLIVRLDSKQPATSEIKINQQWLADKIGISKQYLSDYINMRTGMMSIQRAALIAYYLDCQMDDLFEWDWR